MPTLKHSQHVICITEEIKAAAIGHHPCDLVLVCAANEKLPAHKLILAAASPLLKMILEDTSIPNEIMTTIHFPDIPAHFFRLLLNFLYSGEISLAPYEVEKINNLLLLLQMCDLKKFDISINDSSKAENSIRQLNVQLPQMSKCNTSYPHVKLEPLDDDHIEMDGKKQTGSGGLKSSDIQTLKRLLLLPVNFSTNDKNVVLERLDDGQIPIDGNNQTGSGDFKSSETQTLKRLVSSPVNLSTNDKDGILERLDDDHIQRDGKNQIGSDNLKSSEAKAFKGELSLKIIVPTNNKGRISNSSHCAIVSVPKRRTRKKHIQPGSKRKPVSKKLCCRICDKMFRVPCALRSHMLVHTGEKPYQCQMCFATFSSKSTVFKHIICMHQKRRESEEEEYTCGFCDLCFKTQPNLVTHLGATHSHLCVAETQYVAIKKSVKSDNSDLYFPCELCKAKFKQKFQLYYHFHRKHQDKIIFT